MILLTRVSRGEISRVRSTPVRIQGSSASLLRSSCSSDALTTSRARCLEYFRGPPNTTNCSVSSASMNLAWSVKPFLFSHHAFRVPSRSLLVNHDKKRHFLPLPRRRNFFDINVG